MSRRPLLALLLCIAAPLWALPAFADPLREAVDGLAAKSRSTIIRSLETLSTLNEPRSLLALEALGDKRLRRDGGGRAWVVDPEDDARILDAITGELGTPNGELATPRINNRVRRQLKGLLAQLQLRSPDAAKRLSAAEDLSQRPSTAMLGAIEAALAEEQDGRVKELLLSALAQIQLGGDDRDAKLAAIERIGEVGSRDLRAKLEPFVATDEEGAFVEKDDELREAAEAALARIDRRLFFIDMAGNLFYGLSLASVLLLAALGLAITFGLMGVINMAHGEMLMIGAYTTYVVLGWFESSFPSAVDYYLLAAIPAAFFVSGAIGILLERSVIRLLYGRPLETLLATWGISLILIQTVRTIFGAQNVEVSNPSWLSGGVEVLSGIVLPWSRVSILIFAIVLVSLVALVLQRTRLGLWVRAVTQNREMAASLGIPTARVDALTFGLGSGIAGLGGVALSQIGNVGPELGQSYIVDSFMVVVLGGVGKIVGTVVAATGLGVLNKFLEPVSGAVLGKIFVLGFLILFIQYRPQGIFALKGRAAES